MLTDIIPCLSKMSYSELKDFIDYCEFHYLTPLIDGRKGKDAFYHSVRQRRYGLPTGGLPNVFNMFLQPKKLLEMETKEQLQALDMIEALSNTKNHEALFLLFGKPLEPAGEKGAIAWALLREKKPIRLNSEGNIQIKWIKYKKRLIDENGKPYIIEVQAPYLYLRYWTVQGGIKRDEKRHKSLYIGGNAEGIQDRRKTPYPYRGLAHLLLKLIDEHGVEKQWTDKQTGEIKTYKSRAKGDEDSPIAQVEALILDCIDMEQEPPLIDHEQLQALQDELCNDEHSQADE